jgi:DNA-binding NarL/FixJ family response regulator
MTASPPATPRELRCLIVEDQVMFLQLLRSMLEAMPGLQVVATATRLADAIALCSGDDAPDLLILDLALPDGDGLAVAEALAATRPHSKVVVLSGQASSFVCPAALQPLIAGVVDKTSAFGQLTQVLERCLPHSAEPLTPRQEEIYGLIGQGLTNKEIAQTLGLVEGTVKNYMSDLMTKLESRDRTQAVIRAIAAGLL